MTHPVQDWEILTDSTIGHEKSTEPERWSAQERWVVSGHGEGGQRRCTMQGRGDGRWRWETNPHTTDKHTNIHRTAPDRDGVWNAPSHVNEWEQNETTTTTVRAPTEQKSKQKVIEKQSEREHKRGFRVWGKSKPSSVPLPRFAQCPSLDVSQVMNFFAFGRSWWCAAFTSGAPTAKRRIFPAIVLEMLSMIRVEVFGRGWFEPLMSFSRLVTFNGLLSLVKFLLQSHHDSGDCHWWMSRSASILLGWTVFRPLFDSCLLYAGGTAFLWWLWW